MEMVFCIFSGGVGGYNYSNIHTQNGTIRDKSMKIFCRLAINQTETIFKSRERKGVLYVNGDCKQL